MRDSAPEKRPLQRSAPDQREILGQGLRRAFPVPRSGEFSDLLEAITKADRSALER